MPLAATMRPRSIGTRSSARLRRARVDEGVEAARLRRPGCRRNRTTAPCPAWRPGTAAADCRRSAITVTSSASPRPSDSTTLGVSAPGRWILAMASRTTGERGRGSRRAICISSVATRRSSTNTAAAAATKIDGDPPVIGELDRERRQRADRPAPSRRRRAGAASAARCATSSRNSARRPARRGRGRAARARRRAAVSRP